MIVNFVNVQIIYYIIFYLISKLKIENRKLKFKTKKWSKKETNNLYTHTIITNTIVLGIPGLCGYLLTRRTFKMSDGLNDIKQVFFNRKTIDQEITNDACVLFTEQNELSKCIKNVRFGYYKSILISSTTHLFVPLYWVIYF